VIKSIVARGQAFPWWVVLIEGVEGVASAAVLGWVSLIGGATAIVVAFQMRRTPARQSSDSAEDRA
jgi:uncharacterized membrane protein HdeD (DUF308 family)